MNPEFRVLLLEKCVVNPPPEVNKAAAFPLAALFLPKIIEMGISGIATLLKKAGADETVQVSNSEFTDLYTTDAEQKLSINRKVGCIIGLYGVFADEDRKPTHKDDVALKRLEAAGLIPKDADISIVFEALVVPTADESAFYLDTRYFSVRDFIGNRHKPDRAFVATLTVKTPNPTADGDTIALGNIDLGRVKSDETLAIGNPGQFPKYLSNLMPWKQITEAARDSYKSDAQRNEAAKRTYMPVTFSLTLSETAEGSKFLAAFGELLEGAKAEAAKELSALILPAERAKAAKEESDAAEALYAAEEDAQIEVLKAEAKLAAAEPGDRKTCEAELAKARRIKVRATRLRKAAGLPDLPSAPSGVGRKRGR